MSGIVLTNPTPPLTVVSGGAVVPNAQVAFYTITTSTGTATVHPTSDGTANGTPLFASIFHASATPWYNSGSVTGTPSVTGQTITGVSTITFTITNGTTIALGGSSVAVDTSSVTLTVSIWGTP